MDKRIYISSSLLLALGLLAANHGLLHAADEQVSVSFFFDFFLLRENSHIFWG